MTSRRDFLKKTGAAAAMAAVGSSIHPGLASALTAPPIYPRGVGAFEELPIKELLMDALTAAKAAGASWSDARIGRYRQNFVGTREKQIVQVGDTDSIGIGVRALVNGAWGFAASQTLTRDGVAAAAREAAAIAKANRISGAAPIVLAPAQAYPNATWKSAYEIDPFTIPVEQKAQLLIDANTEAMKVANVKFVNSFLFFIKEDRNYANTDGSFITQTVIRSWVPFTATAVSADFSDFQSRGNTVQPAGRGWEFIVAADLVGNGRKWGEEAAEKLKAKPVDVGRYDLVLHPSHLWLTIHESIGHPTELDRAMGYEANYAGTSFVAPPEKVLGNLKYGPEFMNIQGDRTQEGGCATIGWDDDGVKSESFLIIKNGMFHDYQTSREQAPWLEWYYKKIGQPVKSHGCSNADNWSSVQFQRMPNVSLLPGQQDRKWEDLIAATDKGIAIIGDGSFSIDQQRYNAQFGGQVFYEIKGGKIAGMLKDVAYQMKTTEFWNSMDMIGGKSSYMMGASFFDGKGQPGQIGAVSHGCVPARFRNINVINTGEEVMKREMADSRVMTREQAQSLVERIVKLSKADSIQVNVGGGYNANIRFADNRISTAGGVATANINVQSSYGPKHAVVTTNDFSDAGLERAVRQSEALAKLAPDDPEAMPELGPQQYESVKSYFDSTANLGPEGRAEAARAAIEPCKAAGDVKAAGFLITGISAGAVGNSKGLFAYQSGTSSNYTLTVRTTDGTGSAWVGADHPDWSQVDVKALAKRAIDNARLSRKPVAIEPGRYTVILEPQAVGDLVQLLAFALDARAADEGRSAFSKQGGGTKVGEKIVDERVTLFTDPGDPQLLSNTFDGQGLPAHRVAWIEKGILKRLTYSRFWAQKKNQQPDAGTNAVKFSGGTESTEDLIKSTTRGILVTRLWYLREVDPRTVLYTGLTRDGTFLIENGKITKSVKNLRFNESPLFMLNNLDTLGRAARVAGTEAGGDVVMPTLRVKDFNFTSLSDAV